MAKKEVSPVDTFGEEFVATTLGKRVIDQAAVNSLAVTTSQAGRFWVGMKIFDLCAYLFGWSEKAPKIFNKKQSSGDSAEEPKGE